MSPIILELAWLMPWALLPLGMAGPGAGPWRPYAAAGVVLGTLLGFTGGRSSRRSSREGGERGAGPWVGAVIGTIVITAAALLFRGVQGAEPGMILLGVVGLLLGWWRGSAVSGSISRPGAARRQASRAVLMSLGYVILMVIAGLVEGVPAPIAPAWPVAVLVLAALRLGVGQIQETQWPAADREQSLPLRHQALAAGLFIGAVLFAVIAAGSLLAPELITGAIKGAFGGLMAVLTPVTTALAWLATSGVRLLTPVIFWVRSRTQEPEPQEPGELESGIPEYEAAHQADMPAAVGIVALALLAAALIYVILAFIRSRRPVTEPESIWEVRETMEPRRAVRPPRISRGTGAIAGSDPAARVRRAYRRWLHRQSRAGRRRGAAMTAREYMEFAAAYGLTEKEKETRAEARAEDVKAFTFLYERARYQGPAVTDEEARRAALWARTLDP